MRSFGPTGLLPRAHGSWLPQAARVTVDGSKETLRCDHVSGFWTII